MKIDLFNYSLKNLGQRKMRSWLTVLSILIGIMSIFAIMSFGEGLKNYMDITFEELGTNKIIMQNKEAGPPGSGSVRFTEDEINFIDKINGVEIVAPMMMANVEVKDKYAKKGRWPYIAGIPTDGDKKRLLEQMLTVDIIKGRSLKSSDRLKAVLGYLYQFPEKTFEKEVKLGDKITVNGIEVDVIGFYEEIGNPQDDQNVYLTFEGFNEIFDREDEYEFIYIETSDNVNPSDLAETIEKKFRKYRGNDEGKETFSVQTFEELMETFGSVINILNGVLVLIALISVVVAGVNIMNTMYTSVIERTKEIGVMKAIGARNGDILTIFLVEAGLLGMSGGAIGIVLGYLVAKTGGYIAKLYGLAFLKPYFPLWLILGCFFFAFFVGALAGILPAYQASKQKPVDALRYE